MLWVGTSGYNYPEWKGTFYPPSLPAAKMLPYYAQRFPTVEINYTFYRAPNEKILDGWNKATPDRFKLTLKAPRRITPDARLRDCADRVRQFLETAPVLDALLDAPVELVVLGHVGLDDGDPHRLGFAPPWPPAARAAAADNRRSRPDRPRHREHPHAQPPRWPLRVEQRDYRAGDHRHQQRHPVRPDPRGRRGEA